MRRQSRIDTVLRVRHVQERQALGVLGHARRERAEADRGVQERRHAYDARPHPAQEPLSPLTLRALELQGLGALDAVEVAEGERDEAETRVRTALTAWKVASVRQLSAERLADRARAATATEARRAADRALDELAVLRRQGVPS